MIDYNKLSQTAHEAALKNGWYEGEQVSINTKLALIKSEAYEAFEAFRKGKYCQLNADTHFSIILYSLNNFKEEVDTTSFKELIKDTFEDEIADTVIRICDFCGWYGIELGEVKKLQTKSKGRFDSDLVSIDKLITATYDIVEKDVLSISLTCLLGMLESIAEVYGFDLEQHINLKLAYNATRGYKHGNKVL
jgi:NTP pyrophosphatase (non-canonical NTP hydrolase)